ncbi:TIGR04282 family arsenosugar biosynthesis glycosyltransferase [Echinicola jeungdonensis]|uniref:TIGR04282 family arsenosugar biosynthesis glycosyltransferase n=1 Tax=Echinicola jeungdonensis TaxID=709343 RepID=A0ABV5J6M9_9BACT|nr:TIGR04282 family arsenosugar biosynthesis glycosyltransferase [Echinicola jeungdonensis]MDN3669253.1 TIGR04282 family arsenosugar biosynthesis glycosyltransferase [Echinicola jeungdonensis]
MQDNAIIVFQKAPLEGKVKTRLSAVIGDKKAVEVYRYLLKHTHAILAKYPVDIFVYFQEKVDPSFLNNERYKSGLQTGNDLGEKMKNAFEDVFKKGYQKVAIIGSDCLELNGNILDEAFEALTFQDLVIGPAKDGGYYLLGLKDPYPSLFEHMPWSSPQVYSKTMQEVKSLKLNAHKLPKLADVDEYKDLGELKGILNIP